MTFFWPGKAPVGGERVGTKRGGGILACSSLLVALVAAPAHAAADSGQPHGRSSQVERRPAIADFEGRPLDMAGDWGQARACLVWRQGGVLECFRSSEALDRRAAQLAPARAAHDSSGAVTALSSFSCSSSLSLYDYGGYGGRRVSFWDRGFWQNLGDYGFDDAPSSYIVGGCYAHLAEHPDGAGWWYPGDTSPYHGEAYMYWYWDNRVSSIFVE
jgi:hypothetical protein